MSEIDQHSSAQESGQEEITTEELLSAAIADREIDLHTALPARVESYDASKQTVNVTFMLNRYVPDGSGNFIAEHLPAGADVPVAFPRSANFAITFPLAKGDFGLVVFCERNPGAFRATGNQSDPGDVGMHTLDGAVFYPGLYPDAKALANASGSNMSLGSDTNGSARIVIKPTEIDLGAAATDGVASGTKNDSNLSALAAAIAAVPGTVGPTEPLAVALKAAFATWFGTYVNTASTKVKTEV